MSPRLNVRRSSRRSVSSFGVILSSVTNEVAVMIWLDSLSGVEQPASMRESKRSEVFMLLF